MSGRGAGARGPSVPTILQMEAAECGAACLAMVLCAHGRWESLEAVRDDCGVSRDGASAADIVAAAQRRGLDAEAFSREVDELAALPLPQILFWDFNHFVVLEAIGRSGFLVHDPAHGRRRIDRAEFGRRFTGVTLAFTPTPTFRRIKPPPGTARQLLAMLRGSRGMFATLVLTAIGMVALGVLVPGLTRVFVDDYLVQGHSDWLVPLLAAVLAIGLMGSALAALYTRGVLLLQTKITAVVSARFVRRLFALPYEFFVRRSPVEVSARPQLAAQLAGTVSGALTQLAVHLIAMAGYVAMMLAYSPPLTLVMLLFAGIELLILRAVRRRVAERAVHLQMAAGQAHAAAVQGVALLEQARATGSEAILFNRMLEAQTRLANSEQEHGRTMRLLAALPYAGSRATTLAVLGAGSLLVIETEMTLGTLLGFLMLAGMFSSSVGALTQISAAIGQSAAAIGRLGDALEAGGEDRAADAPASPGLTGRLRLREVGFAYTNGQPLLGGVTLGVEPGEAIGVMGASGDGKSTLARLLAGLLQPTSGEIRFERRDGGWQAPPAGIGFVDQTHFFPGGPLRAALTLWTEAVDDAAIARALADAEIAAVVSARPGGIDCVVGEGGAGFSGGERQRLAIARALLAQPRILVLDDATSALDEATEARLLRNLRRRGTTVILLTNRASALARMDRVEGLYRGMLVPVDAGEIARQAGEAA